MEAIAVVWLLQKLYPTLYRLHNARHVFNEELILCHFIEAWIQQGAISAPGGSLACSDSAVMLSLCYQHVSHHPKGVLCGWDMRARGKKKSCSRWHVPITILQRCVHVKWHLIFLRVSIWIAQCGHEGHIVTLTSICQMELYFCSAPLSRCSAEGSCSLVFLFSADWIGEWHSPLPLQPIQSKVKWCVLSETSFCAPPSSYRAVIYLQPVNLDKFCHSPLTAPTSHRGARSGSSECHPWLSFCSKGTYGLFILVLT